MNKFKKNQLLCALLIFFRLPASQAQTAVHCLPPGFEQQARIALSFYPELSDVPISFVFKPAKLSYASRPDWRSMLTPWRQRRYLIVISTNSTPLRTPTLLKNLDFDAQVGALGHELAHTAYYLQRNWWGILFDGLRYRNPAFKEKFEKMTDEIAIQHGLGDYLLIWCKAVYPVKLKDGNRWKYYHSPEAIEQIIKKGHSDH